MINKNAFHAKVKEQGNVVVIYIAGDGSCLWLNMYLDCDDCQMTCDSDVGFYAYHWGHQCNTGKDFIQFCTRWLANENWLLRKCIGEQNVPMKFEYDATVKSLRQAYAECCGGEELYTTDLEDALNEAVSYSDDKETWMTALQIAADRRYIALPAEWWECVSQDYTPRQKRFAEICREIIAPALREWLDGGEDDA